MFDTFDTADAIPADRKTGAVELKDGKWAVPKVAAAPDPTLGDAGKRALDTERAAREKAETDLKDAQRKLDDAIKAQEAAKANLPKDQLDQWKLERDNAVKAEQEKTAAAEKKLQQFEVERLFRVVAVLPEVNVFMERMDDDNLAWMTRSLGLTGTKQLCVLDAEGKPTTEDVNAHLLAKKKQRPYLFRGAGGSGSGSEASADAGGSAYDPVAAGKAAAAAQKQSREGNKLAFT